MGLMDFFKSILGLDVEVARPRRRKKASRLKPIKKTKKKKLVGIGPARSSKKKVKKKPKPKKVTPRRVGATLKRIKKGGSKTWPKIKIKEPKLKQIGVITHYFDKISVGIIKLSSTLKIGEEIHVKGSTTKLIQIITSMQLNHKSIDLAKKGDEIGIKVLKPVRQGDKVFKM